MLVTDITTIINKGISVGLDAEWRPRNYLSTVVWEDAAAAGEAVAAGDGEQEDGLLPIAVLQLATPDTTYVIDVLALTTTTTSAATTTATLQQTIHSLLSCPTVPKYGFALNNDLTRLEQALPGTTEDAKSLYDLQIAAGRYLSYLNVRRSF